MVGKDAWRSQLVVVKGVGAAALVALASQVVIGGVAGKKWFKMVMSLLDSLIVHVC